MSGIREAVPSCPAVCWWILFAVHTYTPVGAGSVGKKICGSWGQPLSSLSSSCIMNVSSGLGCIFMASAVWRQISIKSATLVVQQAM